jgi:hypothetical protein
VQIRSLLDLFTSSPKGGKTDLDSFHAFQETLVALLRLSGSATHPRLRGIQKRLEAASTCLYAAYMGMQIDEACAITGQSPRVVRKIARELELPMTQKELTNGFQAILLTGLFERDHGGMFQSFQALTRAIEKGSERIVEELERPGADLKEVTSMMEKLSRLTFPLMFLYRDQMDPTLEKKVRKWMSKEWTRTAVRELTAPGPESPTHP